MKDCGVDKSDIGLGGMIDQNFHQQTMHSYFAITERILGIGAVGLSRQTPS
jgi:hypothetical protein